MLVILPGRFIFGEVPWGIQSGCDACPFYLQTAPPSCLQPILHGPKSNPMSSHGCPQLTGQGLGTYNPASFTFQPLPSLIVSFPWAGLREASKSTTFIPIYAFTFTSPSIQNALDLSPQFSIPSHGTLHQACFYAQYSLKAEYLGVIAFCPQLN